MLEKFGLGDLSIRHKLSIMTAVSAGSLILLGMLFYAILKEVKVTGPMYKSIVNEMDLRADILPPPEFIIETHLTALQIAKAKRSGSPDLAKLIQDLSSLKKDYDDRQAYWVQILPSGTQLEKEIRYGIVTESKNSAAEYYRILFRQFLPAIQAGDLQTADALLDHSLGPLYTRHKAAIVKLADLTEKSQGLREQAAIRAINARLFLAVAFTLFCLVITLLFARFTIRGITQPLLRAVEALRAVSQRDLTPRLEEGSDEIGLMATALNKALLAIRQVFRESRTIAQMVSRESSNVETAAQDLSTGTISQAAGLDQTSASMEELSATVRQNAENADQAQQLARLVSESAAGGGAVIDSALHAMQEISTASNTIGEIIGSIDQIAFQTNILAVNATIQAAVALDQGRGFAVVAEQVRALAQRSSLAAREIRSLVQDTVQKVAHGNQFVSRSADTLHQLTASVQKVSVVVADISVACSQQAEGLNQVSASVSAIDHVTQANTEQSQRLFSSARQLSARAVELEKMFASFEIGHA